MSRHRVQVIWAHPRPQSLTAAVVDDILDELRIAGAQVDTLDLYREGFGPSLHEPDEPDWDDLDKSYSQEVTRQAERTKSADAVLFVFPVWWFSLPAIMKGYIDRVWNHGVFYGGGRKADIRKVRWIGLAGETDTFFAKRNYDKLLEHHLNIGIAGFCGIKDSRVELLYNTLGTGVGNVSAHYSELRSHARQLARSVLV